MKKSTVLLTANGSGAEAVFQPITPPTLKHKIVADVRAAILTGKLPPGARIVESRLARQMNVAQTTVREALRDMEVQGFLAKYVNRETLVRKFTPVDLEKLFRLRLELEGLAVELAHPNADGKSLQPLYDHVVEMRRAALKGSMPEFYELDIQFHQQLWSLARNEFLQRAVTPLSVGPVAFVLAGMRAPLEGNYVKVAEDHADILDAFKTDNAGDVRKVMEGKLHGWQAMQLRNLRKVRTFSL
jgi:DNA-binding GntR family transcriptional regulator